MQANGWLSRQCCVGSSRQSSKLQFTREGVDWGTHTTFSEGNESNCPHVSGIFLVLFSGESPFMLPFLIGRAALNRQSLDYIGMSKQQPGSGTGGDLHNLGTTRRPGTSTVEPNRFTCLSAKRLRAPI